jgi:hypothetical protein
VKVKVMRKDWVIKSVSIEKTDAEIIQRQGPGFNLSAFVRECLRRFAVHKEQVLSEHANHGVHERLGFCLPRSFCPLCWPNGPPSAVDWSRFCGLDPTTDRPGYEGPEVGDKEYLLATIQPRFDMNEMKVEGNSPVSRKKSKSFISRALNFLRL